MTEKMNPGSRHVTFWPSLDPAPKVLGSGLTPAPILQSCLDSGSELQFYSQLLRLVLNMF